MPIPIRQLTAAYARRYSNLLNASHRNLSLGIVRDIIPYLAPEGSVYDAVDMLVDKPGAIRKRGGTTSPIGSGVATNAQVENIMSFKSGGYDGLTGIFGSCGKAGQVGVFSYNTGTGAATTISGGIGASTGAKVATPFQHGNYIVAPFSANAALATTLNDIYYCGGGAGTTYLGTAATVLSGDNRVTAMTAGVTAGMLGSIIAMRGAAPNWYIGRIVEVTSGTAVRVDPTPTAGFTATSVAISPAWGVTAAHGIGFVALDAAADVVSGRFGVSYQGRVVLGYTTRTILTDTANYVKGIDLRPNRIYWSQLMTETIPASVTGVLDGDPTLYPGFITGTPGNPYFNYTDIPNLGGITGLAVIGDGQLLVFGPQKMFRISGQLSTNTVANSLLNYSVDQVSSNVGCIEAKSIQYTRNGVIFAGNDNIYQYNGSTLTPLLDGANQVYYQARLRAGDIVTGSAYALNKNHYYLSMTGADLGLMFNLVGNRMTRITNVSIFGSAPDPVDATQLWVMRYWDTSAGAPSMFAGPLLRLDPIWLPVAANANDANGNAVLASLTTRPYLDGTLEAAKLYRELHLDFDLRSAGASPTATVTADTQLNPADASFTTLTQGTLSKSTLPQVAHMDITSQLKEGKAFETKIVQNAAADSFEIRGMDIGFQEKPLT